MYQAKPALFFVYRGGEMWLLQFLSGRFPSQRSLVNTELVILEEMMNF
jgi:hypothetical protein